MKSEIIKREEFYNLVWTKPVSHVAKEYGYSDMGIRKICKKHNIPLPKLGYWSKLKYNKDVIKTKLPKQDSNPVIDIGKKKIEFYRKTELNQELELLLKEVTGPGLIVSKKLSKPHKYIIATKKYQEGLDIRRKKGNWRMEVDSTNALSINVSDKLFSRALRFMDALMKFIEIRGHNISIVNKSTIIGIKNQTYKIRLTEKNKRIKRITSNSWRETDLVPTGNLSLKLDDIYPIKDWSDSKAKPIEDKLVDILEWIELRAKKDEEEDIKNEIRRKNQEKIRLEEQELQNLRDNELKGFGSLLDSASRWHKAQNIRNYIKEFEDYLVKSNNMNDKKNEWVKWAKEKADWYDPFIEKDVKLLDGICRDTLKPIEKKYYYK